MRRSAVAFCQSSCSSDRRRCRPLHLRCCQRERGCLVSLIDGWLSIRPTLNSVRSLCAVLSKQHPSEHADGATSKWPTSDLIGLLRSEKSPFPFSPFLTKKISRGIFPVFANMWGDYTHRYPTDTPLDSHKTPRGSVMHHLTPFGSYENPTGFLWDTCGEKLT